MLAHVSVEQIPIVLTSALIRRMLKDVGHSYMQAAAKHAVRAFLSCAFQQVCADLPISSFSNRPRSPASGRWRKEVPK